MEHLFSNLVDNTKDDIWRYASLYTPLINEANRLTLGEADTPFMEFASLNDKCSTRDSQKRIIFKREDLNPTGSHKSRALAYQVSYYHSKGHNTLLISSSGNAAIAAAAYCNQCDITMISFVDKNTSAAKLNELKKTGQPIIFCVKPINFAKYAARIFNIQNLRPSFDDLSIEPYKSIAFEIFEKYAEDIDAVFMFPTSASSLIGTAKGFLQLKEELGATKKLPALVAVQTGDITSIAEHFTKPEDDRTSDHKAEGTSPGALGVKVTRRTKEAVELINQMNGSGVIVTPKEIEAAAEMLKSVAVSTSKEGAATLAGALKSRGYKKIVCVLTGKEYTEAAKEILGNTYYAESYTDVKNIVRSLI